MAVRVSYRPDDVARTRARKKPVITGIVGGTLACLLVAPMLGLSAASAEEIPEAVTSATLSMTEFQMNQYVRLDFTWAVPDSAVAGDTFTIDLPEELRPVSTTGFALRNPDGVIVANAVWDGKQAVFTLTDFVDDHTGVNGTGYFEVRWDTVNAGTDPTTTTVDINGTAIRVTMTGNAPTRPQPAGSKTAYWTRDDQGALNPTRALTWVVYLPFNEAADPGRVTVDDTIGAGQAVDCATVRFESTDWSTPTPVTTTFPVTSPRIQDYSCSADGLELVVDAVRAKELVTLKYDVTLTDNSRLEYSNTATLTTATGSTEVSKVRARSAAGGDGNGEDVVVPTVPPTTPATTPPPTVPPTTDPSDEPTDPPTCQTPSPSDPATPGDPTSPAPSTDPADCPTPPATHSPEPSPSTTPSCQVPTSPAGAATVPADCPTVPTTHTGAARASGLATTGSDATPLAVGGGVLLLLGSAAVWASRRRAHGAR